MLLLALSAHAADLVCPPGARAVVSDDASTAHCTVDGRRHGPFRTLWPGGTIQEVGTYADGELDGPFTRTFADGTVALKGTYVAGKREGWWFIGADAHASWVSERWYANGELVFSGMPRDKNKVLPTPPAQQPLQCPDDARLVGEACVRTGVRHGPERTTVAGHVRSLGNWKDGQREGLQTWFFAAAPGLVCTPQCPKEREITFVAGLPDGPVKHWHPNGQVALQGTYVQGQRDGTWAWFDAGGKPVRESTYAKGKVQ